MAPINIGTDREVIIGPQTSFAHWTLASVDTNTTLQTLLRQIVKIRAKFQGSPDLNIRSLTHNSQDIYSEQYHASLSDLFHLCQSCMRCKCRQEVTNNNGKKKIMYNVCKKEYIEKIQTGLNCIRAGSDVWPLAFVFMIKRALLSIYEYFQYQPTHILQTVLSDGDYFRP
jgi:hypothetical protein